MNLVQLKTFLTVARTMSFTAAAEELMLSQPAVSKQITALEGEIGALLFVREHNTLHLTNAGKMLAEELPEKLTDLENTFFTAHLVDLGKINKIKIGVLEDQRLDARLVSVAREMRDSNCYVIMQQYDFIGLEQALERQEIDAAVCIKWAENAFENCEEQKIGEERLCIAINQEYKSQVPKLMTRENLEVFSRERPTMIPEIASFLKREQGAVAARTAQFWDGVKEEPVKMFLPMVLTGIGSAVVNEEHSLSQEAGVQLYPLDFLSPVEKYVFTQKGWKNQTLLEFLDRMKKG